MITDVIVLAVLLISALIAFIRGFIRETLTILGVGGGLAAAYFGGPVAAPLIKGWLGVKEGTPPERLFGFIPYDILGDVLSYGVIFISIVIILSIVSHILAESVRAVGLGAVDRGLGVLFGLARGLLVLAVLYLPVHLSLDDETKASWFTGSKTQPMLETMADALAEYMPDSTVKKIQDTVKSGAETAEDAATAKDAVDAIKGDAPPPAQDQKPAGNGTGYSDEFRQKMDDMFKQDAAPSQPAPHPESETTPAVPSE